MTAHPVFPSALNLVAAAYRARSRGMTAAEARALQQREAAHLPEDHPLARALARFVGEVSGAHADAARVGVAALALQYVATLCMQPELPARADIHG